MEIVCEEWFLKKNPEIIHIVHQELLNIESNTPIQVKCPSSPIFNTITRFHSAAKNDPKSLCRELMETVFFVRSTEEVQNSTFWFHPRGNQSQVRDDTISEEIQAAEDFANWVFYMWCTLLTHREMDPSSSSTINYDWWSLTLQSLMELIAEQFSSQYASPILRLHILRLASFRSLLHQALKEDMSSRYSRDIEKLIVSLLKMVLSYHRERTLPSEVEVLCWTFLGILLECFPLQETRKEDFRGLIMQCYERSSEEAQYLCWKRLLKLSESGVEEEWFKSMFNSCWEVSYSFFPVQFLHPSKELFSGISESESLHTVRIAWHPRHPLQWESMHSTAADDGMKFATGSHPREWDFPSLASYCIQLFSINSPLSSFLAESGQDYAREWRKFQVYRLIMSLDILIDGIFKCDIHQDQSIHHMDTVRCHVSSVVLTVAESQNLLISSTNDLPILLDRVCFWRQLVQFDSYASGEELHADSVVGEENLSIEEFCQLTWETLFLCHLSVGRIQREFGDIDYNMSTGKLSALVAELTRCLALASQCRTRLRITDSHLRDKLKSRRRSVTSQNQYRIFLEMIDVIDSSLRSLLEWLPDHTCIVATLVVLGLPIASARQLATQAATGVVSKGTTVPVTEKHLLPPLLVTTGGALIICELLSIWCRKLQQQDTRRTFGHPLRGFNHINEIASRLGLYEKNFNHHEDNLMVVCVASICVYLPALLVASDELCTDETCSTARMIFNTNDWFRRVSWPAPRCPCCQNLYGVVESHPNPIGTTATAVEESLPVITGGILSYNGLRFLTVIITSTLSQSVLSAPEKFQWLLASGVYKGTHRLRLFYPSRKSQFPDDSFPSSDLDQWYTSLKSSGLHVSSLIMAALLPQFRECRELYEVLAAIRLDNIIYRKSCYSEGVHGGKLAWQLLCSVIPTSLPLPFLAFRDLIETQKNSFGIRGVPCFTFSLLEWLTSPPEELWTDIQRLPKPLGSVEYTSEYGVISSFSTSRAVSTKASIETLDSPIKTSSTPGVNLSLVNLLSFNVLVCPPLAPNFIFSHLRRRTSRPLVPTTIHALQQSLWAHWWCSMYESNGTMLTENCFGGIALLLVEMVRCSFNTVNTRQIQQDDNFYPEDMELSERFRRRRSQPTIGAARCIFPHCTTDTLFFYISFALGMLPTIITNSTPSLSNCCHCEIPSSCGTQCEKMPLPWAAVPPGPYVASSRVIATVIWFIQRLTLFATVEESPIITQQESDEAGMEKIQRILHVLAKATFAFSAAMNLALQNALEWRLTCPPIRSEFMVSELNAAVEGLISSNDVMAAAEERVRIPLPVDLLPVDPGHAWWFGQWLHWLLALTDALRRSITLLIAVVPRQNSLAVTNARAALGVLATDCSFFDSVASSMGVILDEALSVALSSACAGENLSPCLVEHIDSFTLSQSTGPDWITVLTDLNALNEEVKCDLEEYIDDNHSVINDSPTQP